MVWIFGRRNLVMCGLIAALSVIAWGQGTSSPLPRFVKFSGSSSDAGGAPRTGTFGITFAIYSAPTGGASLWMETQNVNLDANGKYSVLLGSTVSDGLPADLFNNGQARWLGVQVQLLGEVEQTRILLVSVPYAMKAGDAETLGGLPSSAYALAGSGGTSGSSSTTGPVVTASLISNGGSPSGTTNHLAKFDSSST